MRKSGHTLESVALDTLREAHAFAAEHQRLLLADAVAIQEIDSKGKAVGEPFPLKANTQMASRPTLGQTAPVEACARSEPC